MYQSNLYLYSFFFPSFILNNYSDFQILSHNNQSILITSMQGEEQVQTIQFYKIQLMQKQREISDFESKLKKIQFKNNLNLKEAKGNEQRAKNLLKEEKAKADRISKQASQNQEQNKLLQLRLNELKQEKEKEILEVRAQYNSIKEQVRSYERILPTHTFLTEIARSIDQLPTYEDIFLNFKEKTEQYADLTNKFEAYKNKNQELIRAYQQNEEMLKMKKLQAQRNFKEVLPKIIEYQHQISDLKISCEEYHTTINDLRTQLQIQRSKSASLEDTLRQFQSQVEQMKQAFTHQLQNKQQQVRLSYQQEIDRYEQQIKSLSSRMDIKDNMYISQIHILEEEINFLHNKCQVDKDKYEELLAQYKEEADAIKNQYQKAKLEMQQLQSKSQEMIKNLIQVSGENEQLQEKLRGSQKKILQAAQIHIKETKLFQQNNQSKIQQYSEKLFNLSEQYKKLKQAYSQLNQQRQSMKLQNQQLRQQISNQGSNSQVMNNLDLPNGSFEYEQRLRRKSTDYDKYEEEIIAVNNQQLEELQRERSKTIELIKKTQDFESEKENMKDELEGLKAQLQLKGKQIADLQQIVAQHKFQVQNLSSKTSELQKLNSQQEQKLKMSLQENNKLSNQSQQQREKILLLTKSLNENQLTIAANNSKQSFYKAKIQSLEQQLKIILEEDKKNKQLIKVQKEEIKSNKEQQAMSTEKSSKEIKQLTSQIDVLKQQKEQLRTQFASKEKSLNYEIAIMKNNKDLEQKLKNQINTLNQDLSKAQQDKIALSKKYAQLTKEYEQSKKEIQKLQLQNLQKDRQNEMISQSLNRQRRERTLRTVPSLQSLQGEQQMAQQQNFNDIYLTITRKEGQINILQREVSDLKEQIESLKISQQNKMESLQAQQNDYIQTIIQMKIKCAQSQMRASEKQYLYTQIKRKLALNGIK